MYDQHDVYRLKKDKAKGNKFYRKEVKDKAKEKKFYRKEVKTSFLLLGLF